MKKITYLLVFGSLYLTSCKKEYTCDCVISTEQQFLDANGDAIDTPVTSTITSSEKFRAKKKDAKTECEGSNGAVVQNVDMGGETAKQTVNTTCTLK